MDSTINITFTIDSDGDVVQTSDVTSSPEFLVTQPALPVAHPVFLQQFPVIPQTYLPANPFRVLKDPKKRTASSDSTDPAQQSKRHSSAGSHTTPEERALMAKILNNKACNAVERLDTFSLRDDSPDDIVLPDKDVKVPKEELDRFLESIPLDDRAELGGSTDDTIAAMTMLKCKFNKRGDPVVPGMKISLMPHQLIGVKWMVERENNPVLGRKVKIQGDENKSYGTVKTVSTVGGGLLADEMGLGKTIQSIALMAHNRPDEDEPTTLIVAPLALVRQWKREIERRTKRGAFKVHIHHGSAQLQSTKEFLQYDVVITTYGTLMAGYPIHQIPRRQGMTDDEKQYWQEWLEEHSGIMFKIEWFRIILDEAHCIKNPRTRCSQACGTLLAGRKWCLTGTPFHNSLKDAYGLFRFLELPVFRTYAHFKENFESDPKEGAFKMQVALRSLMLRRKKDDDINGRPLIVLPEKTIKEEYVEFSQEERELYKAVEDRARININKYLKARVAMKNYSNILAMLIRLRQLCIHPFLIVEYISKEWTAEEVAGALSASTHENSSALSKLISEIAETPAGDWSECPLCLDAPTAPVITSCRHVFCADCINEVFEQPTAHGTTEDDEEVEELGNSIACPVCRRKLGKADIHPFTPPKDKDAKLPPAEAIEEYKKTTTYVNLADSDDDDDDDGLPSPQKLLQGLKIKKEVNTQVHTVALPEVSQSKVIPPFDPEADEDFLEFFKKNSVDTVETRKEAHISDSWAELLACEWVPSTKLEALRKQLLEWRENYPEDKIIVFSQFVRALDLIERMLDDEGWQCTRYQGAMSLEEREASIREFEDNDNIPLMLTSLKCGGVGLNLTVANRVVCVDLWWNWQIENQAIDRCHRTGQTKPVHVTRIIVKDSVEDRILALQDKKKTLAAAALGDSQDGRIGKLSLQELVGLFGKVTKDRFGNMRVE